MISIERLDHLVLTVASIEGTVAFYCQVLGMEKVVFGEGRVALVYGQQKINLHQQGHEFEPKAQTPQPGSADLCFVLNVALAQAQQHLAHLNIDIEEGPVIRTGALGPIDSIYIRDPDQNLIELSCYRNE